MTGTHVDAVDRARLSLEGLSLRDAFGDRFFYVSIHELIETRELPDGPWFYSDDTIMAWSIVDVLRECDGIDQDRLASLFASRFVEQPNRGYGGAAIGLLERVAGGADWRVEASRLFGGQGSMGNGGAMRAAPVGAYFAGDLDRVVDEARASAAVTHTHPDGLAGAIAVAVGAAVAFENRGSVDCGKEILEQAYACTPDGPTRDGIGRSIEVGPSAMAPDVAVALGSGRELLSSDTVPFALWCASRFGCGFEESLWQTASGLGDVDTTCAIVGGISSLIVGAEGLPVNWLRRREPLEVAS